MPNIEIHGFTVKEEQSVKNKIAELLRDKPFLLDTTITFCRDKTQWLTVISEETKDVRLVRVISDNSEELEEIVKVFEKHWDVEPIKCEKFRPKKE